MASFGPLVIVVRWGTVALGIGLAALDGDEPRRLLLWGAPLVVFSAWRTVRPLRYLTESLDSLARVLFEVGLTLAVVVATGYWSSPYVFALATAILAAGFARGFGFALRTALTAVLAVALPYHLVDPSAMWNTSIQWATELLLVGVVGGYAKRLFGVAEEQTALAQQANELLAQLHQITRTLPSSLDLEQTIDDTLRDVRAICDPERVLVILRDPDDSGWTVVRAEGARLAPTTLSATLEPALPQAGEPRSRRVTAGPFLTDDAVEAVHLPLVARNRHIGTVVAESTTPGAFAAADLHVADALLRRAALAVDNAHWFTLLRRVGADEERNRIARDLHDRVGQSLAFVGFELDRIGRQTDGTDLSGDLQVLRQEVTSVVGEIRDTLYDLRTDVSEERGIVPTLTSYLARVRERTGLRVDLDHDEVARLPFRQEREVWRIAQEAVNNAVRHASADQLWVRWYHDGRGALLEVRDDGKGVSAGGLRADSYGLRGMRERAAAIGARLTIDDADGGGTLVRCEIHT